MAIIDDLNNLQANILTAKQVLADNISSKGVSVSSKDTLTYLANSITKIEQGSGGSGKWVLPKYIRFGYSSWDTISDEVKYADWSNVNSMSYMFYNNNILSTFDLNDLVTSNVTDMSYMFYNCTSLKSLDLSNWDTSNVTNMTRIFQGCSGLISLDISNWNTSKVISYSYMFSNCKSLSEIKMCNCSDSTIQFISNRLNDTGILSNVTIITECESNNEVISLSCDFDKSTQITDLYFDMDNLPEEYGYWWVGFSYNPNQEGDCNNCNWSNGNLRICLYENRYEGIMNGQITDLEQVNGLYHLHLDEPLYFICGEENAHLERYYLTPNKSASCDDTISFRWDGNASDSFEFELEMRTRNVYREECKDNGDGTYTYTTTLSDMGIDNLTYCSYVFVHSHNLVELIKFPCTDNVTSMRNMFQSCNILTSLDLSSFNVYNVNEMNNMFSSCSNLETLNLNGWKLNDMVDVNNMFNSCDNLREIYLKNSDNTTYMKIQDALNQSGINAIIITE